MNEDPRETITKPGYIRRTPLQKKKVFDVASFGFVEKHGNDSQYIY